MAKRVFIFAFTICSIFILTSLADATTTWLGYVQIHLAHRAENYVWSYNGQPVVDNLADYNDYKISFEYYKEGVTDHPNVVIWQNIDAQVQLVQDSSQKVIGHAYAQLIGKNGNNAEYEIRFYSINPNTISQMDAELQNRQIMKTHLQIIMDGVIKLSMPINYSYQP